MTKIKMLGIVAGLATLGATVPAFAHEGGGERFEHRFEGRGGRFGEGRFGEGGRFQEGREGWRFRREMRERELRRQERFGYGGWDLRAPMYRGW